MDGGGELKLKLKISDISYFHKGSFMVKKGDKVKWQWGANWAEGKVKQVYEDTVTKEIKGKEITRHGSKDNPALLIENDDGEVTLHLESRVEKAK